MAEAELRHSGATIDFTPSTGISAGQMVQLKDGRAGFATADISSGVLGVAQVSGVVRVTKASNVNILNGGDVYWDYSADNATYKQVDDRDFFIGVAVGDWASSSTIVEIALNIEGRYLIDVNRDGFRTAMIGTQALSTMGLYRRGGAHNFQIAATSEAEKVDILSVHGFANTANAIIEGIFAVPNDGAGTVVDVSLGVANGTNATDADAITEHVFVHLDANATAIKLQSKDTSTTVAATDTTLTYTEGSGVSNLVEFWMDMRNPADVQIYINGVLALGATVFNVNAAVGPWKLLAHIEKTSAADVYELDLHRLRARISEE